MATPRVRTILRALAVANAAAVLGAAAIAAPAAGVAPGPEPSVDLAPGHVVIWNAVVGDDAVYYAPTFGAGAIYRRSLDREGASARLGRPTLVGRTDGQFAEHDGALAYSRQVDGRLVMRSPDGAETMPAWGDHPALVLGVSSLDDQWLVSGDARFGGESGWPLASRMIFDRWTGAAYSVVSLVDPPEGLTTTAVVSLVVADGRAVFSLSSSGETGWHYGVYTVALGQDGFDGPVVTLDESFSGTDQDALLYAVAVDDGSVTWVRYECAWPNGVEVCDENVRWYDAAPYSGAPRELALGTRFARERDAGILVTTDPRRLWAQRIEWIDTAADPPTSVRALDVPGRLSALRWPVVVWQPEGAAARLAVTDAHELTADQTAPGPFPPFSDISRSEPYYGAINWLWDRGVVGGYVDHTFRNLASVTREAMAAFLYRAANGGGRAPACEEAPFADVPASHPFCGEIAWLAEAGVSTGWADGTFRPGQPVTREAMAAFLYRLAEGGNAPSCDAAPFADVTAGHPFCGAISWMAETGISTGWPDDTFRPGLTIERQAMAAFLFRFIDGGHVPAT